MASLADSGEYAVRETSRSPMTSGYIFLSYSRGTLRGGQKDASRVALAPILFE